MSKFSSGGGFSAQHKVPRRRLASFVAPSVTDELNTLRVALVVVACWRVNHVLFGFDSSFVMPAIREELKELAALVRANPGSPASVFGHADPASNDDFNKALSGRRAQAIFGLLTRNVDLWEELHAQSHGPDDWGLKSIQVMLAALPSGRGFPFYDGAIDGIHGPRTKDALRRFQQANGLAVDGVAGPATRKVLFRSYMNVICVGPDDQFVMAPEAFIGEGADGGGKGAMQGCSEFNPVVVFSKRTAQQLEQDKPDRDARNAPNRRVMVFLFRPDPKVAAADWPCPRVKEGVAGCKSKFWPDGDVRRQPAGEDREYRFARNTMACRFYDHFARLSPCEGVVRPTFRIRLFDIFGERMTNAVFEVTGPGIAENGTSRNGDVIVHNVPAPSTIRLRWGRPLVERRASRFNGAGVLEPFEFEQDIHVDMTSGSETDTLTKRLENLGYGATPVLTGRVKAFQRDCNQDPTGIAADAASEVTLRHDTCRPPKARGQ